MLFALLAACTAAEPEDSAEPARAPVPTYLVVEYDCADGVNTAFTFPMEAPLTGTRYLAYSGAGGNQWEQLGLNWYPGATWEEDAEGHCDDSVAPEGGRVVLAYFPE